MDYFESFGLEPRLSLDLEDLQRRFYERSRQWHPDRFSRAGAEQQQKALDTTAVLNDAFRTLRDPIKRAEYFLKERGVELSKEPPPELLEEVFELNMALEELREGDEAARPQLVEAQKRFAGMRAEIDSALAQLFSLHDAAADGAQVNAALDEIRGALNRRRYVSNLIRTVDQELGEAAGADRSPEKELNVNVPD
jgi:molecular chaperone HscB